MSKDPKDAREQNPRDDEGNGDDACDNESSFGAARASHWDNEVNRHVPYPVDPAKHQTVLFWQLYIVGLLQRAAGWAGKPA